MHTMGAGKGTVREEVKDFADMASLAVTTSFQNT